MSASDLEDSDTSSVSEVSSKRTHQHPAHLHFTYNDEKNISECRLCSLQISGKHAGNLRRHLRRSHLHEIDQPEVLAPCKIRKPLLGHKQKLTIYMSSEDIIAALVELITANGRSFCIVNDSGLRKILDPLLQSCCPPLVVNSDNILDHVATRAESIRQSLAEDVKGKLLSVKVDAATRLDRSFLGINLQYVQDGKLVLRTLAVKEMFVPHTAYNVALEIQSVLNKYNIPMKSLYTVTTDNGSNMVKAIEVLGEVQDESFLMEVMIDVAEELTDLDDAFEYIDIHEGNRVVSVRCGEHTLQLAIKDALKKCGDCFINVIPKARQIVKKLRTPTYLRLIKSMNLKKPVLDVDPRWDSCYDMLSSIIEIEEAIKDLSNNTAEQGFQMQQEEWKVVHSIVEALKSAKKASKVLQGEQLTPSMFFETWVTCEIDTNEIEHNPLAVALVAAMQNRGRQLFRNPVILASIFLDPRLNVLLSQEEIKLARQHLIDLWERLDNNTSVERKEQLETIAVAGPSRATSEPPPKKLTGLDELIRFKERQTKRARTVPLVRFDMKGALTKFKALPVIDRSENILSWWQRHRSKFPELFQLATTVNSVPATSVSVERLFSGVKFILSPQRANMSAERLDDVMVVRMNIIFGGGVQ